MKKVQRIELERPRRRARLSGLHVHGNAPLIFKLDHVSEVRVEVPHQLFRHFDFRRYIHVPWFSYFVELLEATNCLKWTQLVISSLLDIGS